MSMQVDSIRVCWVDGAIVPTNQAVVRADDSGFAEGRSCYTSVRIAEGQPRFADRHTARIRDGAHALRLGELSAETVRRALDELAAKALPGGEGVIRLQASCDREGGIHLIGVARGLGDDKAVWSAIIPSRSHDGASLLMGQKTTSRLTLALAAEEAKMAGADEAVLLDAEENLVEGARTNILIASPDGSLSTPPIASGAVAGIARSIAIERVAEIKERVISKPELLAAAEIIAVNAVRGARPITRLDGQIVGGGSPGGWSARLAAILAAE
jgi:branched-subunit amino acid aminotransferase/4-amino-4-deoxychorismate lyase